MADAQKDNETKTTKTNTKATNSSTQTNLGGGLVADRESDRNPLADKEATKTSDTSGRDTTGTRAYGQVDRGEQLAQEAVEDRSATGGDTKLVKKDGVYSAVTNPVEDHSDNGKVYKDVRIDPRDTNAPDAGLTPDGRRIAE